MVDGPVIGFIINSGIFITRELHSAAVSTIVRKIREPPPFLGVTTWWLDHGIG
jgi:hypothetical protein